MKKFLTIFFILGLILVVYYIKPIYTYLDINYINKEAFNREIVQNKDYVFNIDTGYVEITNKVIIEERQDLLDTLYTALNYGLDKVEFYCDNKYSDCFQDLKQIAEKDVEVINDLVHPFNKYRKIEINQNNLGKVTVRFEKIYSSEKIIYIKNVIENILNSVNIENITEIDKKIKTIHDYLVNYASYSTDEESDKDAYGFLTNKKGNCRGYTETMLILLHEINVKSLPISNGIHAWNFVQGESGWKHVDVTWDDPVSANGKQYLIHDFFMISSTKLQSLDKNNEHIYDTEFYNNIIERNLVVK